MFEKLRGAVDSAVTKITTKELNEKNLADAVWDLQMVLIGHLDTVMAYDLENYGYKEDGDLVMGLGSADMKGGCAAMVEAFVALTENDLSLVPAALALVVGEEEEGDGTNRLIEEYHFPWAIIGEHRHGCRST